MADLPTDLQPPEISDGDLIQAIDLVREIEYSYDLGDHEAATAHCKALIALTGRDHLQAETYFSISGAMSYEQAAKLAFCPPARPISGLTYAQFRTLCTLLLDARATDFHDYWIDLFAANCRNSEGLGLLFSPPQDWTQRLVNTGQVPPGTTPMTLQLTPDILAKEGWRADP